jgi:hypothetical protein
VGDCFSNQAACLAFHRKWQRRSGVNAYHNSLEPFCDVTDGPLRIGNKRLDQKNAVVGLAMINIHESAMAQINTCACGFRTSTPLDL